MPIGNARKPKLITPVSFGFAAIGFEREGTLEHVASRTLSDHCFLGARAIFTAAVNVDVPVDSFLLVSAKRIERDDDSIGLKRHAG